MSTTARQSLPNLHQKTKSMKVNDDKFNSDKKNKLIIPIKKLKKTSQNDKFILQLKNLGQGMTKSASER